MREGWEMAAMLSAILLAVVDLSSAQKYCLATDHNPYLFFATKTAYEFVYKKSISHRPVSGCRPQKMWMLSKHGTSYPNWQKIRAISQLISIRDNIIQNHENRDGELCFEDLEALRRWKWDVSADKGDKLTEQGRRDVVFLAKRLRTNFPAIFDSHRFTFRSSQDETARMSARDFSEELLGRSQDPEVMPELSVENCSALIQPEVTSKFQFELEKFRQSPLATNAISYISSRLGFKYNLSLETVWDIYDACRYEKAWNYSVTSPWCAAFTKPDLQALEYFEDLNHYYRNGYGNNLALKFSCPLVKDLMHFFRLSAEEETGEPEAVFTWASEAVLEAVMSRLGIANDNGALPASLRTLSTWEKRQWRTAFISPYSGNIAAVFYKCDSGEANQVMFYINEHLVEYEGCRVGLCSWKYLEQRFTPVIRGSCGYEFCDPAYSSSSHHRVMSILAVLVISWMVPRVLWIS